MTTPFGEELKRKSIHMISAAIPLAYALSGHRAWAIAILAATSAGVLIVESFRHRENALGRLFRRFFAPMLREKELEAAPEGKSWMNPSGWLGATPYCLASLACVIVFPRPTAVLALLYLAVGDTAASLVGKTWGRTKIGEKSVEGTAAFFISTAAVAVIAHGLSGEYPLAGGIAAALIAALAELLLPGVDDNLSIPAAAGATMFFVGLF